jgi:hypothetical protein
MILSYVGLKLFQHVHIAFASWPARKTQHRARKFEPSHAKRSLAATCIGNACRDIGVCFQQSINILRGCTKRVTVERCVRSEGGFTYEAEKRITNSPCNAEQRSHAPVPAITKAATTASTVTVMNFIVGTIGFRVSAAKPKRCGR